METFLKWRILPPSSTARMIEFLGLDGIAGHIISGYVFCSPKIGLHLRVDCHLTLFACAAGNLYACTKILCKTFLFSCLLPSIFA
jgi:hypothetical protein